jgi:hypothetical protein
VSIRKPHQDYCTNLPVARECMKDPTTFCMVCRCIAGEGPENWETELAPHDVAAVWTRRGKERGGSAGSAVDGDAEAVAEIERQRVMWNTAKQDAVRIVWTARESCTSNSTAAQLLTRVLDHIVTPERWS